jgi:hypothetical protein
MKKYKSEVEIRSIGVIEMALTIEQQEAVDKENRALKSTYDFMTAHIHDFAPNEANKEVLMRYMEEQNLPWCQASLEQAFRERKEFLTPPVDPNGEIRAAEQLIEQTPWPSFSTKADVLKMDRTIYKQFYYSKKHGAAFRAAVDAALARG